MRSLTVEIGTGNDDLREGSKVELTFVVRGQRNHTVEIAKGIRWPDRTQQKIEIELPYSADLSQFERIDVRFVANRRALMEDDKWWFTSLVVRNRTGSSTIYANNAVNHKFERDDTWTTGVLPNFRRTSGHLITVRDEAGRPARDAVVFLGTIRLGTTNSAGQLNTTSSITGSSQLIVKHRVHEQDYYRSNHAFDSTRNWNYRVYLTNLNVLDSGVIVPLFTVRGENVDVVVGTKRVLFGLNILTVLEWDMPQVEEATWRNLAAQFSQHLFNCTDGQFFVERFRVVDQARAWDDSDFRVRADWNYRANVPNHTGGFLGWNIAPTMMNMSRSNNFRVYTHEFGHFGLDVRDEYRDNDASVFCSVLVNGTGPFASFQPQASCMMFHQDVAPKICSNHAANMHRQGTRQGSMSCWDKIISRWSSPGRWDLINPSMRRTIPGTITLAGSPVNHEFMLPVTTFDNVNRPGSRAPISIRVSSSSGVEANARVVLRETGNLARDIYMGVTDGSGNMRVDGVHTGDAIIVISADNRRFAIAFVPSSGFNLNITLTPLEETWFAQTRPGGNDPIIPPGQAGPGYGLPVACKLDGSSVLVTVSNPIGVTSVDEVVFQPAGGRAVTQKPVRQGDVWITRFTLQGWQDGQIYARGKGSNGRDAFGMAGLLLTSAPDKPDMEVFGPGGAMALHDLQRPKERILMTFEGFDGLPDKVRTGVLRLDGAAAAFNGSRMEIRLPSPYTAVIPSKGQATPAPRMLKYDDAKKTWSPVPGQVWNPTWQMISAPTAGPGLYVVAG
ncbi:hypothetical protein QPK87_18945 [Kamptonema cortianum]|nr:hypothetical protein [Kamptonema cortianum]